MMYPPPPPPPKMEMIDMQTKSPLEHALGEKKKIDRVKQKYMLKDRKKMPMPMMQWEGDDQS